MIACMFSTKPRKVEAESILPYHKGYAVTTDPFLVGPAVEVSFRPPKVTPQRSKVVLGSSRGSLEPVGPGARRTKTRFWVE
jgi:hypothetical protein